MLFRSVLKKRTLSSAEINLLKVWSDLFASLINNQKAEYLLEQTKENYEFFFNTIDEFLFVLDADGYIVHTNNTVYSRLGYLKEDLIGKSILQLHPDEVRDEAVWLFDDMLAGKTGQSNLPIITKGGNYIPVETLVNNGIWNSKPAVFVVIKDITRLQIVQQQLMQSEKFAALGKLMANLAHEINTPLGAILSSCQNSIDALNFYKENFENFYSNSKDKVNLLIDAVFKNLDNPVSLSTKEEREIRRNIKIQLREIGIEDYDDISYDIISLGIYDDFIKYMPVFRSENYRDLLNFSIKMTGLIQSMNIIKTAVDRTSKVIYALKIYSRLDSNSKPVMSKIISGIEAVLTLYQNLTKNGVTIIKDYNFDGDILCYPDELNQIWTNLISNSLHSMKNEGNLYINVNKNDGFVVVSIRDTGCGIPEKDFDRIFDTFYTTKSSGEGTGLGLDIVSKIVEKHKGKIEFESVVNKGTEFRIFLPVSNII